MENTFTFWMIFVEGGHGPTFRHRTMDSAQKEAERLARMYPGTKVYILKADVFALIAQLPCTFTETNGIAPDEISF